MFFQITFIKRICCWENVPDPFPSIFPPLVLGKWFVCNLRRLTYLRKFGVSPDIVVSLEIDPSPEIDVSPVYCVSPEIMCPRRSTYLRRLVFYCHVLYDKQAALDRKEWAKGVLMALYLNERDLRERAVDAVPMSELSLTAAAVPENYAVRLLGVLADRCVCFPSSQR